MTSVSTALDPFDFNGNSIRVVMIDGEPWFVAADVAKILGYRNGPDAMRMLRDREKGTHPVRTPGGVQDSTIISEQGLYRLVMRSERGEAEAFQDWVTGEVLPTIRKTGAYVVSPKAMDPLDALQVMIDQMRIQRDHLVQHDRAILELGARTERLEAGYERLAATGFANLRGLRHDVGYLNRLGKTAAAIARRDGVPVEKAHSTIFGTVNAWPVEVWDEALSRIGG